MIQASLMFLAVLLIRGNHLTEIVVMFISKDSAIREVFGESRNNLFKANATLIHRKKLSFEHHGNRIFCKGQQSEPTTAEIKEQMKEEKPALNLESTLKLVEVLHRRKVQRDKLLGTISTLEALEVAQIHDAGEANGDSF